MAHSGVPGFATPNDGDYIIRELEAMKQSMRETFAEMSRSTVHLVRQITQLGECNNFENPFSGTVTSSLQTSFSEFIAVPEGYDKVSVIAYTAATARNDGATPDVFIASAGVWVYGASAGRLNGGSGTSDARQFGAGEWAYPRATNLLSDDGLVELAGVEGVGALSIEVALMVRTQNGNAVTKDTGNVSAIAIFSR
ncbi:MAG: hypothetical protein CVT64_11955 [Actinobacteria bacterium HGW-Actinobacteria-4]|nr:MAG: hypothetical protein CVT64_11955 [Actinobacteria bacterium HGW-Actinobacteria-4]